MFTLYVLVFRFSGHTICVTAAAGVGVRVPVSETVGVNDGERVGERVWVCVMVGERVSVGDFVGDGGGGYE